MSDTSILLTVEAVDRASNIIGKIGDMMDAMSGKLMAASQRATMSSAELQMAQDRAAASAAAYEGALGAQGAAQTALRNDTIALTRAQETYTAAAATAAGATQAQADAVTAATARQIASLDALRVAEDATLVRAGEAAAAQAGLSTSLVSGATAMKGAAVAAGALAVGIGIVADKSVHAAADFQTDMIRMVTSAGESTDALADLSSGVLKLSVDTATGTNELSKGLYFIESSGYHAADALHILQAAAEGARAEQADLAEVGNALTTVMKEYRFATEDSTKVMDMMVAAVGSGKMTMQQFASSLATVLPTARSASISFEQVAGAVATMTSQGITAQQATMDLNHIIQKLQSPTIDSTKYLAQLGISSSDLAANLGKRGLTGTMELITKAIAEHTQGGKVLVDSFNQSKAAAGDLDIMLKSMPPNLRQMSENVRDGSMSFKDYNAAVKELSGPQHAMGIQFVALMNNADGFNQLLKSGQPAALEYTSALKKVVGDATSLHAALALTNGGLGSFDEHVKIVADSAAIAGDHVNGWGEITETFNFKMAKLKDTVHAIEVAIGTGLLPVVSHLAEKIAAVVTPLAEWMMKHEHLTAVVLISIGVLTALAAIVLTVILVSGALAVAIEAVGAAIGTIMAATGVGLAIMALGVAAYYVATHWQQTKDVLSSVWKWIVDAAQSTADFFVGIWKDIVRFWDELWGEIGGTVKKWWPVILAPVTGGLSVIVAVIIKYRKEIGDAFQSVWEFLVDVWNASGGKLVSLISHAWGVVSESVSKEWHRISDDLVTIWGELITLWDATGGKLVAYISDHWAQISAITDATWRVISTGIKQVVGYIWSVISSYFTLVVDFLKLTWDVVWTITKVAWELIWSYLKGILDLIWGIIKAAFDLIWMVIKVAFDAIVLVFEVAWDLIKGVINTALDLIKGIINIFIDLFTGQWGKMWHDIWHTVVTVAKDIWDTIKSVFGDIWRWLVSVMGNIKDGLVGAWGAIWDGIKGFLSNIWDGIKSAFREGLSALGGIWNDLKKLAADPVNFVIDTVYNHGIRTLWNDVSGVFGGPKLDTIGRIGFADGGLVPGVGNRDTVPAMLMPGEFVLSHKMIDAMGGITAVMGAFGSGTNDKKHFWGGGLVNDVWDGIKDAAGHVKNLALGGLRAAAQSGFDVVNRLLGGIPGAGTGFGKEMVTGVRTMEHSILDLLGRKDKEAPKGTGDPLDTWVRQALAITGKPISWFSGLETIAMHESGGNPNAINNWDINAQNGDPSRGLMQTIGATFQAYHQNGTSYNIYDPVANVAAAINYISRRYGDISNVPGLRAMGGGGAYVGYENGTWDTGSFSRMALLHPHEAVLPASVAAGARGGGYGAGGGGNLVLDMRGSQIMSQRHVDELIDKIERRVATRILPAGGVRIRM